VSTSPAARQASRAVVTDRSSLYLVTTVWICITCSCPDVDVENVFGRPPTGPDQLPGQLHTSVRVDVIGDEVTARYW
jgi:hypothetical protein